WLLLCLVMWKLCSLSAKAVQQKSIFEADIFHVFHARFFDVNIFDVHLFDVQIKNHLAYGVGSKKGKNS
ncbi:hypothetical protein, partial [Bartonella florencae]|uniref:hypothetical protein n=1 Tax=Bartonella florencae TaxID=928210 RepID=UPI001AEBFA17